MILPRRIFTSVMVKIPKPITTSGVTVGSCPSRGIPGKIWQHDLNDGVLWLMANPVGNWHVESAGDVFNNPANAIWKTLTVSPGTYKLKLTPDSQAYQLNEFLWGNEGNYSTPIWNAYVQMYVEYNDGSNASFNFGDWSQAQGTEADVLALYHSTFIDGMVLNLTKGGTIYFYINDYNSVDNGGSVSLEFDKICPVPVPGGLVVAWQCFGVNVYPATFCRQLRIFRGAPWGALNFFAWKQLPLLFKSMQRLG